MAGAADPTNWFRRNANDQRMGRNVTRYDSTSTDEAEGAEGDSGEYRCIGSDGGTASDTRRAKFCAPADHGTWIGYVGKYCTRTHEHIGFQDHTIVEAHVVLDAAAVPDDGCACHVAILTDDAITTDDRTARYVAKVPNLAVGPDASRLVDDRSGMDLGFEHGRDAVTN